MMAGGTEAALAEGLVRVAVSTAAATAAAAVAVMAEVMAATEAARWVALQVAAMVVALGVVREDWLEERRVEAAVALRADIWAVAGMAARAEAARAAAE